MNEDSARYVLCSKEQRIMTPLRCYYNKDTNSWVEFDKATLHTKEQTQDPKFNYTSQWVWIKVEN